MATPREIVTSYYAAFDRHDFAAARQLMDDGFRFSGPMMGANSPEELFAQMQAFECEFQNRILQLVESGSTVAVLSECTFTQPFSATIRMSEWFTVEGGKLTSSTLIYDTRQMPGPDGA